MNLVTANRQNQTRCTNPITSAGVVRDYMKVLRVVEANPYHAYNRVELLDAALPEKQFGKKIEAGIWSVRAGCSMFATFTANELLKYSPMTKRWTKGRNFDKYMREFNQ